MSSHAWIEVRLGVPQAWEEWAAYVLSEPPYTGAALPDERLQPGELGAPELRAREAGPPSRYSWLRGYAPLGPEVDEERLRARIALLVERAAVEELEQLVVECRIVPAEDWATQWRESWKPFRVPPFCIVLPDWNGPLRPEDRLLRLEPGGVFGTGRHVTTRHVLRLLPRFLSPGDRVLDAGTGSGILATAAGLLGARDLCGFDIDPVSPAAARALADRHGQAEHSRFYAGTIEQLPAHESDFDGLIANIYAEPLLEETPKFAGRLRAGAWFILSGISQQHLASVSRRIETLGYRVEADRVRGRWHALAGHWFPPAGER